MTAPAYDLLEQPWLRVRTLEGEIQEVSLREIFRRSGEIADLAGESASQNFAVFRVLVAILIRALRSQGLEDDPVDLWQEQLADGSFRDQVDAYLVSHRLRFDLFHPETPFMQVADLRTKKGSYDTAAQLIPDVGPGLFSTRTRTDADILAPAEAARWLIRVHAYDVSGIKSGAVGDDRVRSGKGYPIGTGWTGAVGGIQIVGPTLADSLFLNLPVDALEEGDDPWADDLPPWERIPDGPAPRFMDESRPNGIVDILTWQQRRVRLWPGADGKVHRVLITNGDRVARANTFVDPMTGYRFSAAQSKKGISTFYPKTHDPDLTVWRGIEGLFAAHGPFARAAKGSDREPDKRAETLVQIDDTLADAIHEHFGSATVGLRLVGAVYGTQDAVLVAEIEDSIPVSIGLLGPEGREIRMEAVEAAALVMRYRGSFQWFLKQLAYSGGDSPDGAPAGPTEAWLVELEQEFRQWLSRFQEHIEPLNAAAAWRESMKRVTLRHIAAAVQAAGPRAAVGRIGENESGSGILHSSARYETWAQGKLKELIDPQTTGTRSATAPTHSAHDARGDD